MLIILLIFIKFCICYILRRVVWNKFGLNLNHVPLFTHYSVSWLSGQAYQTQAFVFLFSRVPVVTLLFLATSRTPEHFWVKGFQLTVIWLSLLIPGMCDWLTVPLPYVCLSFCLHVCLIYFFVCLAVFYKLLLIKTAPYSFCYIYPAHCYLMLYFVYHNLHIK